MPRPPPPAAALIISGKPIGAAAAISAALLWSSGSAPEMVGTPAARAMRFAPALSAIWRIAAGGGPTQVNPASITACAKSAFSARKP